jgi:hypothetical protein
MICPVGTAYDEDLPGKTCALEAYRTARLLDLRQPAEPDGNRRGRIGPAVLRRRRLCFANAQNTLQEFHDILLLASIENAAAIQ